MPSIWLTGNLCVKSACCERPPVNNSNVPSLLPVISVYQIRKFTKFYKNINKSLDS